MDYIYAIFSLLGGLGAFLIGMNLMSDNMKKLANTKLKSLFKTTSKSKIAGLGIGTGVTMIVQSSSLTTVMTVGLVNAGIMSLSQAATIIMGANIGTTITAQIVALQSFSFTQFAVALSFIGVIIQIVSKKEKNKTIGQILSGLGLIFLGLEFMSESMKIFRESEMITSQFASINNPFLLLLIGIVVTALVQSSSAVTSIIISMATAGIVIGSGGNSVLYVILGTNIGTCVTAILSSIGTNTNAKRVAVIHLLFNVFGAVLFTVFLLIFPNFMANTFEKWFIFPATQIAMFHTTFNIICAMLFLPISKYFVKISEKIIKDHEVKKDELINMDNRLLKTPSVALMQLSNEIIHLSDEAMKSLEIAFMGFVSKDISSENTVIEIKKKLDIMNKELTEYLVKVSSLDVLEDDEKIITTFHYNLGDIDRIGELASNITKYTNHYVNDDLIFSNDVIQSLEEMFEKVKLLYEEVKNVLNNDTYDLTKVDQIEDEIDHHRKLLVDNHIKRLNEGKCQIKNSGVFINLVGNLERAADHLTFIAHHKIENML